MTHHLFKSKISRLVKSFEQSYIMFNNFIDIAHHWAAAVTGAIDHMHMTSQKGAPARWGSNEALPRALSPSMQPEGQPLHAIPPGWPGPAHWLRGWAPMRSASSTRARSPTSLDPQHGVVVMETWRQCIRSIVHRMIVSEVEGLEFNLNACFSVYISSSLCDCCCPRDEFKLFYSYWCFFEIINLSSCYFRGPLRAM